MLSTATRLLKEFVGHPRNMNSVCLNYSQQEFNIRNLMESGNSSSRPQDTPRLSVQELIVVYVKQTGAKK
jgi:hypothetical protein